MLAEITITPLHWAGFIVCILIFLALDLGVFHRRAHVVKFKEALAWTAVWFAVAMLFAAGLLKLKGQEDAVEFVTGYLIELSLSMDNVFVIALLFAYFKVPSEHQHRVLFWGIIGALIMRGVLIGVGAALVLRFQWVLYVFGAFLVFSGLKMFFADDGGVEPENNLVLKLARRFFPIAPQFEGQKFFTRLEDKSMPAPASPFTPAESSPASPAAPAASPGPPPDPAARHGPGTGAPGRRPGGRWALTPLALVLLMVETTDLVFALDSIPAIFGVTQKAFIVFTSNVFAILGLRSLYFVLANAIDYFRFLKYGLALVLVFIGGKMLAEKWDLHIATKFSLSVVAGIILLSILLSVLSTRKPPQ